MFDPKRPVPPATATGGLRIRARPAASPTTASGGSPVTGGASASCVRSQTCRNATTIPREFVFTAADFERVRN